MAEPTHTAVGTWSGGRFMHYGVPLEDDRLAALLRPDEGVATLLTADTYGQGAADTLLGRALSGVPRGEYSLIGAIGHDFYAGERDGPRGFPRFTDPRLRGPEAYSDYVRMATERSLERCDVDAFDVLLLHNPDRTGFTSPSVWKALEAVRDAGLTHRLGVAPGPANGFTLDFIDCLERFGPLIDWAMLILNPLEPWPAELALEAAARHGVDVIARVVDYGGLFWDDVLPGHEFAPRDHRGFRPAGWVEAGRERMELMRPTAERHDLTMLQLAAQWDLAHPAVRCVAPTLIQEPDGPLAKPAEVKRAELAATPAEILLSDEEVAQLGGLGDNRGTMSLKGASPEHEGDSRPDRWALDPGLVDLARRWGIDPERDLRRLLPPPGEVDAGQPTVRTRPPTA
jgi:aryl-alcohol dehydrogenase-like predicted oxidoreductase